MKVKCLHGYFIFEETTSEQISRFASQFNVDISMDGDRFVFDDLLDAPRYSIAGGLFLNCPTTKTFEGEPWEVMRANGIVYDFQLGAVVPILSVTTFVSIYSTANYFVTTGMMLAGSVTDDGSRVTDYAAFYIPDRVNFKYSEIDYL